MLNAEPSLSVVSTLDVAEQAQRILGRIVYALVDRKDAVRIVATGSVPLLCFRIEVDPSDIGGLIGEIGCAIRILMAGIGEQIGSNISVSIVR
jgi:predicted RNA-binding protein YlqC (UPF0109 family)